MTGKKEGIRILEIKCINCEITNSCSLRRNLTKENYEEFFEVETSKRHLNQKKIDCLINFARSIK